MYIKIYINFIETYGLCKLNKSKNLLKGQLIN